MQNDLYRITGVSPAYFISRYGTSFTCRHIEKSLTDLKNLDFHSLQLEIFDYGAADTWFKGGFRSLLNSIEENNMNVSLFVGHYLGNAFVSAASLADPVFTERLDSLLSLLTPLKDSIPLAVPLLPMEDGDAPSKEKAADLLASWSKRTKDSGRDLIVEIVPRSVCGTYSGFLDENCWAENCTDVGFLLDTGHAHVTGEDIPELIRTMGNRLKRLHLSDNDGIDNKSLAPGEGNLNWKAIMTSLDDASYEGAIDIEIVADNNELADSYTKGKDYLLSLCK